MQLSSIQQFLSAHMTLTQITFYAVILCGLWIIEWRLAAQPIVRKLRHTAFNTAFMLLALPTQLAMMSIVIAAAHWCTMGHWGLLYLLPYHNSAWIKFGLMFFVLDFLDYAYHYAAHQIPWLWRLHLVHHSDRHVDVSTTFREHPLETLVRTAVLCVWVVLCGASLPLLVLRQTFESIANIGQHSRFHLPDRVMRWMRYVFVTPDMHHAHHHAWLPGTDCNYGDVLSIWDRLFGTKILLRNNEIQFGVDTHLNRDSDLASLLGLASVSRLVPAHVARRMKRG